MNALEAGALTLQGAKRQIAREKNPRGESDPAQLGTEAMQFAAAAISQLSKIRADDPQFLAATERVRIHLGNRMKHAKGAQNKPREASPGNS